MITVEINVNSNVDKVWNAWTKPEHITKWNFATDEWQCPKAVNDLKPGGKLNWRMEAKDGSMGFDFEGTYDEIIKNELISYTIADGRRVNVKFEPKKHEVTVTESFEAEGSISDEMQRQGWQAILINFKKYVESI